MIKILVLCTGNSCRSQIAEGFLNQYKEIEAFSAGTKPSSQVNQNAVEVMREVGIDISGNIPKKVDIFLRDQFDYVITVCDSANETCPVFLGKVGQRLHIGFEDPDGREIDKFREVRDLIKVKMDELAESALNKE